MTIQRIQQVGDISPIPTSTRIITKTIERYVRISSSANSSLPYTNNQIPKSTVERLKTQRQSEIERLNYLNTKFNNYLNRVKCLEDLNKKLLNSISDAKKNLRENLNKSRNDLEKPLEDLRRNLNDKAEEKALIELREKSCEYVAKSMKEKLHDLEIESARHSNRINNLNDYNEKLKTDLNDLREDFNKASNRVKIAREKLQHLDSSVKVLNDDLDKETLNRLNQQFQNQTLMEQIEFTRNLHSTLKKELENEIKATASKEKQNLDIKFFQNELKKSISEIRKDFESIAIRSKSELENYYITKLDKFKKEIELNRLEHYENQIKLREESKILKELNTICLSQMDEQYRINQSLDSKYDELNRRLVKIREDKHILTNQREIEIENLKARIKENLNVYHIEKIALDSEISLYRRLLDTVNQNVPESQLEKDDHKKSNKTNFYLKEIFKDLTTTPKKSNLKKANFFMNKPSDNHLDVFGSICIKEVSVDIKYIIIENINEDIEFDLSGWLIERIIDESLNSQSYNLPPNTKIKPCSKICLWAGSRDDNKNHPNLDDENFLNMFVVTIKEWLPGNIIYTKLYDLDLKLRAVHTKKVNKNL